MQLQAAVKGFLFKQVVVSNNDSTMGYSDALINFLVKYVEM